MWSSGLKTSDRRPIILVGVGAGVQFLLNGYRPTGGLIGGNVGTPSNDSKGSIPDAAYLPRGISIGRLYSGGRLQRSGGTGVSSSESPPRVTFFGGTSAHIPSVSLFCNPRTVARFHTIPEQGKNRTPKQSIPEQHGSDPKTVYSRAAHPTE